jgi:LPS sulfotransferase NodH
MRVGDAARFVVFAAPRTGSNLLCSLLNAHPDILCHHGLFNPGGIHWARDWQGCSGFPGDMPERDNDPAAFIDAIWASGGAARAVGFKMNRDENDDAARVLLRDPSVRKILLRRRNRVRTYVSEEVARLTGIWESFDPPAETGIPAVHVDADDLVRHSALNAAYYAAIEETLQATGQGWFGTYYEALADPGELTGILAFLGVEAHVPLPAASHKRGPADLGAAVENFDELADALRGTALLEDLYREDVPELSRHEFTAQERP